MRYLSEQWITAADKAVKSAAGSAPKGRIVIDQVIEGSISYRIVIDGDDASITQHANDELRVEDTADARFSQSLATAAAVAQGQTDAHQAFLLGHIRFDGDVSVLIERRASLVWLETVLAPVLAQTEFTTG